ncbi:MAG: branched-chain amino acid transport system ATP-binding protein [Afipia broomeae]|jgi:branched-chain amino acid transport system ATP-binding protein|nr:MAG: ATP-binding cassette domain-containing protein [Bradyrhizobiaceae bacterium]
MSSVLLEVRDLGIKFGGVVAASGINLDVSNGESLAIIGPNGAGKTTFLNICTGWLKPANGTVRFEGRDITAHPPREIARLGISRAFQIPQLFTGHTVIENMLIAASAHADRRNPLQRLDRIPERQSMLDLLALIGCSDVADHVSLHLSEGQRKLVDIGMALALKPKLLLLDEPTAGVASSEKFQVMDMIVAALAERAVTSVFVEHDMEMVTRYANRVAVWTSGCILRDGSPADVLSDAEVIRTVIGG